MSELLFLVELFAVIFSVVQVVLAAKNKVSNYLFGIVGVLLSIYLLYYSQLYAESVLYLYYLVMSIYGYAQWRWGKQHQPQPISYNTLQDWFISSGIVVVAFLIFYFVLIYITDSNVPVADACVSAFAWSGMWLMAKRKMENWIFLNISNLINIPLLFYKGLNLYAILTILLFIMAIVGFLNWKKIIDNK